LEQHTYPDLKAAWIKGLEFFDTKRGDELALHVTDNGKCDFQVWGRRNGYDQIANGPKTRARLQAGLHMESFVYDRITAGLADGWQIISTGLRVTDDDGRIGHLDALIGRSKCLCGAWCDAIHEYADAPGEFSVHCSACGDDAPEGDDVVIQRAYFDVKTTAFKEVWVESGEFFPDTGRPIKRKTYVPYDDFPGAGYHFQSGGYCRMLPPNPDGKHMPYYVAAFDWYSKDFVPFGPFDSDEPGFVAKLDAETAHKLAVTAPGVDPVAAGIATLRLDGAMAGSPPEDTFNAKGKSWACGYCNFAECALNTNPDAEVL
jgi:hypothetical protein